MMTRYRAFTVFALLVFGAAAASATEPPAYDVRAAFIETDRNGDNAIEINEFYDRLVDIYFLGDADKDGFLSEEEFVKVVVIKEDFTQIDKNSDGKLSKKEFVSGRLEMFFVIDTDDDGALSLAEVTGALEARPAK